MPVVLRGKVSSGFGNFGYWIGLLADHYFRKTGLELYPGTLNLQLEQPYVLPDTALRLEKEECTMYQLSVYPITPSLWRWEIRSGGALLACGTAATKVAAEKAGNEIVNT